jgi:hypothetical protein
MPKYTSDFSFVLMIGFLAACDPHAPTPVPAASPASSLPSSKPRLDDDPALLLDLADIYLRHQRVDRALELFTKVLHATSDPAVLGRAAYGCALAHRRKQSWAPAFGYFRTALEHAEDARKPSIRMALAQTYLDSGQEAAARAEFVEVVLAAAFDPEAGTRAAQALLTAYARAGAAEAAPFWEIECGRQPKNGIALELLAETYRLVLRDPAKAAGCYDRLRRIDPGRTVFIQRLLDCYQAAGRLSDCARVCREYAEETSGDAAAQWRLYEIDYVVQSKNFAAALELLQRLRSTELSDSMRRNVDIARWKVVKEAGQIEKELETADARSKLLLYEHVQPDARKFLEIAEPMLPAHPQDAELRIACAARLATVNRAADAEKLYAEAFALGRDHLARHLNDYLNVLLAQNKDDAAVAFLKETERGRPDLRVACVERRFLVETHRRNAAEVETLAEALVQVTAEVDPAVALRIAGTLKQGGQAARALRVLDRLDAGSGDGNLRAQSRMERLDLYERMGRLPEAEALCRELLASSLGDGAKQTLEKKLLELLHKQKKPVKLDGQ